PLLHPEDASAYMAPVGTAQRERGRVQAAVRARPPHGDWGRRAASAPAHRERGRLQAEVRVRHRNGDWRWIESYALPLFSDDKEYLGHIGTSLDITERKRVEEARAEADSRKDQLRA